ncbi:hypothetical protein CPB83DRAFT_236779 [Crepidotus variabilis]|uniref:Peptidase M20 dimerisation domain-containing protein n=1 Tax=Crepidotus variabilis TaxID=179855 RepID=A0A9P6EHM4_9AGAR|nr:hypothetical protein CPB83DRAFT_236779 [Crepidotus variabilis]
MGFFESKLTLESITSTDVCVQPRPAALPSNISRFVEEPGFSDQAAQRLLGAVRIPTMTFDDMGPITEDERWRPFGEFHTYLQGSFPRIHSQLRLEYVGGYSLVYTWVGKDKKAEPLLLTGHLDVVPATTALDRWTYPPFSGVIQDGWLYGRGVGDCKNNVIGIMTAVEHLIKIGWEPTKTIVMAFGQDEESSGQRGAKKIAEYLETAYGTHGVGLIVDEGGMGLDTIYGTEFALPAVAEKGFMNIDIQVDMEGGHASVPPKHTSIGILSKVVSNIEDSATFTPELKRDSPIWGYVSCLARHGDASLVPTWLREAVGAKHPDFRQVAQTLARESAAIRYLMQTSKAATIFNAGVKNNALAEVAKATFNSRVELYSSVKSVRQIYHDLTEPIAKRYSLRLQNRTLSDEPSIGNITISWTEERDSEPSPISPFHMNQSQTGAWSIFSRAVQATFGKNVITAPSAMTGNTGEPYLSNSIRAKLSMPLRYKILCTSSFARFLVF